MQLIRALLIAAIVVVVLSGISIFFGSRKQEKKSSIYFLVATLGAALWTIAIAIALKMPGASPEFVHTTITCIIAGVTLCDVGLLAFLSWRYKGGKPLTFIFTLFGALLVALLAYDSSLFYSSYDLSQEYVRIFINYSWYYFALIAYFFLISITFSSFLLKRIKETTNSSLKTGLKVFYVGLSIGGILALIFDLVLITSLPNLIWIGPMATIISIMSFYYSVVKFRTLNISARWMKLMSYVILTATAVIIYLLVFYIVFTTLFRTPNPSVEVLILNGIMAIFLIAMMPALLELTDFMKASFLSDRIQLGYITKKLDNIKPKDFNPRELVQFLADTLHYEDCALILAKHTYVTNNMRFPADEVEEILRLKPTDGLIWVKSSEKTLKNGFCVSEVATLKDSKGKEIGRLVFGKRIGGKTFQRKELVKVEAVVNMVSALVEESHKV